MGTSESTSSTSYTNLATTGPTISGLSDGKYVIIHGCNAVISAAGQAHQSLSINGSTPASSPDTDSCQTQSTSSTSIARALTKTLSGGGNNTIQAKYRVTANTGTFGTRWIIALRYGN